MISLAHFSTGQHLSRSGFPLWPTAYFYTHSFIGTQPCQFVYMLSVAVCMLQWQKWLVAVEAVLLTERKIFIWIFAEKGCWTLVERILEDMAGPKSSPGSHDSSSVIHSCRQRERIKDFPGVLEVLQACAPFYRQPLPTKQAVNLNPTLLLWEGWKEWL